MSIMEQIKKRRSVRTFDGAALSDSDAKAVMDYAAGVDNPYELRIEWRLLDAKTHGLTSPVIVGSDTYIAGKMRREPHAEEAFGYAFEKVVLFAGSLGIGTTWIAGTMNRSAFERAMELGSGEVMPCVSPLGYPAKKMSMRETLMRKGVKADSRLDFGSLFFDGSFDKPLSEARTGKLNAAFEAVRLAPSAVNKQPWRVVLTENMAHFYEKRSRGYVDESGWDIQKIDMGIALCHFEVMARECGMDLDLEIASPDIPVSEDMEYIASYIIK